MSCNHLDIRSAWKSMVASCVCACVCVCVWLPPRGDPGNTCGYMWLKPTATSRTCGVSPVLESCFLVSLPSDLQPEVKYIFARE